MFRAVHELSNKDIFVNVQRIGILIIWEERPVKEKLLMYKNYYVPIVTYDGETWTMTERDWSRLQAEEIKFLIAVKGKTRKDRVKIVEIRKDFKQESMREEIERKRFRWYGHVKRMHVQGLHKIMEKLKMDGKRPRGRPRTRWKMGVRISIERRAGSSVDEDWMSAKSIETKVRQTFIGGR
ncbi:uncharacterized protein LOC126214895 [Schistocerca nitens]|uniref:uncharacterized protein LOC126214895 n=1 Tax=Schistocerca nitens TaxID=7011 RepID=UPI0021180DF0|nr:uncharacterized protein LOC126214895 [Schistocerca nitens]